MQAYLSLEKTFARLNNLDHLSSIVGWDNATMMSSKGSASRSAAMAELDIMRHQVLTDAQLKQLLTSAQAEDLNQWQQANLREMKRRWEGENLLPTELVEKQAIIHGRCEHAWRTQRPANDWPGFLTNLNEVVALGRERAERLSQARGLGRYDALMDQFEPGMTSLHIDRIFSDLKTWLPGFIAQAQHKQASETVHNAVGPFAIEQQRALGVEIMQLLQFDFSGGRLDVSTHPFCGGVPDDVRITTRYRTDDFAGSLMGIVHETGHARYEQNRPAQWLAQPVSQARSMGIHESQSLSFEMQIGCNPSFMRLIAPLVKKYLGNQAAFAPENLGKLYTRVKPGFIRVDADELCYPAHIILRYEIERALIEGEIEAAQIPSIWDEKMMTYLGVDTRGNFKDGCMQDIHWTDGMFGYFPSYTLGAMYAAQYFASMRQLKPTLDSDIERGDFGFIFDWLKTNIWSVGSQLETNALVQQATGEVLNTSHFKSHLQARYL